MKSKTTNTLYLLAVLVTIIVTVAHNFLPPRVYTLVPNQNEHVIFLFSDQEIGGTSTNKLLNDEQSHWQCDLRGNAESSYCGYTFVLSRGSDWTDGIDLSAFDTLEMEIEYSGPTEVLRLHIRDYNPLFSNPDDYNSAKFNTVNLRRPDLNRTLVLNLADLDPADWWLEMFNIPRELSHPSFSNVTSLTLDFPTPVKPGTHEVKIKNFRFTGRWISGENLYLSILIFWMVAIAVITTQRIIYLNRREQRREKRIRELIQDNIDLKSDADKYKLLSTTDSLTRLYNRLGFNLVIDNAFKQRTDTNKLSIILIDVDHFKRINDRRGHQTGDDVLVQLADVINQNIREKDSLARWGGEEFILFCPQTNEKNAYILAEKIRDIIATNPFGPQDKPITMTASFGVGTAERDEDFESLFRRVDQALYTAKNRGRNCTILADSLPADGEAELF